MIGHRYAHDLTSIVKSWYDIYVTMRQHTKYTSREKPNIGCVCVCVFLFDQATFDFVTIKFNSLFSNIYVHSWPLFDPFFLSFQLIRLNFFVSCFFFLVTSYLNYTDVLLFTLKLLCICVFVLLCVSVCCCSDSLCMGCSGLLQTFCCIYFLCVSFVAYENNGVGNDGHFICRNELTIIVILFSFVLPLGSPSWRFFCVRTDKKGNKNVWL